MPLPPPPGNAIKAASANGITNPALLDTLVKVRSWAAAAAAAGVAAAAHAGGVWSSFLATHVPCDPALMPRNVPLRVSICLLVPVPAAHLTLAAWLLHA